MKFKKIITGFLCFISLFVFIFGFSNNILVNASVMLDYEFTHGYYNPGRDLISVNASTKFFYSSKYNSSDFSLSNTVRLMVGKIGYTSSTDVFRQYIFNFDNYEIKEYNNNIYIYIPAVNYEMGNCTHTVSTDTYSTSTTLSGFTTMGYKALIKINPDFSTIKIAAFDKFLNTVSVDDFIMDDLSGSISYFERLNLYNVFYEYQSTFNIKGETFQNNADIENPTYQGTLLGDKKAFINWIIEEQKYTVFRDYGLENTIEVVDDIVNLYEQFNKNPLSLFFNVPSFLIQNGSIFSNVDKARELINYVSALYQEFKLERRPVIFTPEKHQYLYPQPYIDDTVTDKYIDNETDTIDISLLREILRTLIIMPQNIFDFLDYYMYNISVNTSLLVDYVGQLPNYLTDLMYNKFISPINSIIDAIDNIDTGGGSTSIDVIIPNEKEVEFNDFLNLWNNNFNDIIDNKFPVANQLSSLFDDFFVKAGISTDKDNLIYSYYNPNTVGSAGDTDLSDFYATFDNANTSYLNDVGYSDDIPSLSIKIKGVKTEVINFKFYAKYRQQIFTIMSFILWFAFLLSLYKSLPNIIGNVSDITNTVDEFESKIDKGDNW